jgi:hypothetical protein
VRGLRRSGGGAPAGADEAVPAPRSAEHGTNATDKDKTSQAGPVSGGGAGAAEPRRGGFTEEERRLFPGLTGAIQASASPPLPSRTNWTSLVPPLVLTGQTSSLPSYELDMPRPLSRTRTAPPFSNPGLPQGSGGAESGAATRKVSLRALNPRFAPRRAPCA